MNYRSHYDRLIGRAQARNWNKKTAPVYVEIHHIVPRCMGGTDMKNNLAVLTAEEHYVAHLLLIKIFKGTEFYYKMVKAATMMRTSSATHAGCRLTNKQVGWLKRAAANASKKENLSMETREKISLANRRRGPVTKEARQKMSEAHKHRAPTSDETKQKLRKAAKNLPKLCCPYCGLRSSAVGPMKKFHFDNCELKP